MSKIKPPLERRHLEAIAAIIKSMPDKHHRDYTLTHFSHALKAYNHSFDLARFQSACGAYDGECIDDRQTT